MIFRVLTISNFLFVLLAIALYAMDAGSGSKNELTIQRLNIVDSLGRPFIVLSSPEKQAFPIMDGRLLDSLQKRRSIPGILFFNGEGDEIGGIMYHADSLNHYQFISFDQRKNDQVLTIQKDEYLEDGQWKRSYGMLLKERGDAPLRDFISDLRRIEKITDSAARTEAMEAFLADPRYHVTRCAFFGRTDEGNTGMFLYDRKSRPRLFIYVDSVGNPIIEKIDSLGIRQSVLSRVR